MPKGVKKFVNGYRAKMRTSLPKGLRNLSMGTRQKNGNVFAKRYYKICQWVQDKKWGRLCQKMLRNSSMGTGQKMGTSLPKGVKKFVNRYRANR